MKSSTQSAEPDNKKRYVFFSDPDIIVKRAETSAVAAQIKRDFEAQQQVSKSQSADLPTPALDIKSLENLLSYHPVQPYPFTFISAVKQKLALGGHPNINTNHQYNPVSQARNSLTSSVLKTNCRQNSYQVVQKMDFIRPLKVPDLKISPKTLDFSSRENSVSKELPSTKPEMAAKEFAHDRSDKTVKIGERVQRKLDFSSSDGPSAINCESIEPLKAPNVSIASNLSKKKEHARDSSREKENRSKRIKKDDSQCTKRDESGQDQVKRSRSPRHVSRRDAVDSMSGRLKNDRLPFHMTKNSDSLPTKSKVRNFITSTSKKDNDKRQRSFNAQSVELTRDIPLESKGRTCGNKALDFVSCKVSDKVTIRDNMPIISSNIENKSKDHLRQVEDLKYKCDSDNRQAKQDKANSTHKEPTKRVFDKNKTSNSKIEGKIYSANSEPSEDVECISDTNSSKNRISVYPVSSVLQSKSKDPETMVESKQNVTSVRSAKTSENFKYTEHSATQSASASTKKDEDSYSQSIVTNKQTTTNDDTNDVDVSALPEALFDPRRISFRDSSYSQQEEFHNLSTPDKIDFMLKSKQKRYLMQSSDSEVDARCPKYKPVKSEKEQEKIQLMHPTALHMQFQAELHLLDSFNESLRHVMDVEKCLYNTKSEQEQKNPQKESEEGEEIQVRESRATAVADNDAAEKTARKPLDCAKKDVAEAWKSSACDNDAHFIREHHVPNQGNVDETVKIIKVAEVQTQTVNDVATQTDTYVDKRNAHNRLSEIRENVYERSFLRENQAPELSMDSAEQFEDLDQIEEISLPSRIRTMSEISLHETTSSIKTETGTEISISTRDVTCSFKSNEFNNYLSQEMAQLIKDEEQRKDRVDLYFKIYQKTLNDQTRKLVKLEEQKRVLRDTGQDSRISSVKKKQRALLLKIQHEEETMIKMKEVHEIFSQERNTMFQKQRDTFNPQMSTKNILTKLKRSADSQSPRRLSGPMKGYDIRSNSSISSLIDSDKSQHDRSQVDTHMQASESDVHLSKPDSAKSDKSVNLAEESNTFDELAESNELQEKSPLKTQKKGDMPRYELKSRKYEEKMPGADVLRLKQSQLDMESKRIQDRPMKIKRLLENQRPIEVSQSSRPELDASAPDYVKSESDTLVEELSKRSRMSQAIDPSVQTAKEKELAFNIVTANSESVEVETSSKAQDAVSKATKSSQVSEDLLQMNNNKSFKKIDKTVASDRDVSKKLQHNAESRASAKRKSSKYQKTKSSSVPTENILRSKSSSHLAEELVKHHDKRTRIENEVSDNKDESSVLGELDLNESQGSLRALVNYSKAVRDKNSKLLSEIANDYEGKENVSGQSSNRKLEDGENLPRNERIAQNVSTSQISTFAISHHSSEESEKNFSRSVVVRRQDRDIRMSKKLEQILTAREAALASRKKCVDGWMAWYNRLKAEEQSVTRMEQALLKLVATKSNVLSQQGNDTTFSSDTSDVEGRIEILTEKLAKRRIEMTRLKKEVRKQAKQKLHALETHLENQIKGYDTTILKLHKMLESKKTVKDKDKLAIEPRSLANFKIPEIPLKRIQNIYRNSDLLRSRSESDLLSTRNRQKVSLSAVTYDDRHERSGSQKSTRSADVRSSSISGMKSATYTNYSVEEYTSTESRDKLRTATSVSSNDARFEKYTASALGTDDGQESAGTRQNSVSRDAEDIQTIISTARSEAQTISDARSSVDRGTINTESASERIITRTSIDQPKSQSEIPEEARDVDYSKSVASKSDYTTESGAHVTVAASNHDILSFSKKVDFLQLNNKNLSENISSVENGLKALLEMMSRFSNKTNEVSKAADDERSTSQDISEIMSRSVLSDRVANVEDEEKETVSPEREVESLSVSTNGRKSRSFNDLSHDEYTTERGNSEVSPVIPEEANALSNSPREIDYEAKSKEIMNEIEKSIISEHNKVTRGDYNVSAVLENDMRNFRKDNEELLNDLVSLETDIRSISEILSKVSESRRSLDLATNAAMRIIGDSKGDASVRSDPNDAKLEENLEEDRTSASHSPRLSASSSVRSTHSPIIAGHRTKESRETNSRGENAQSAVSSRISRALAGDSLKSSEDISEVLEVGTSVADDSEASRNLKRDEDTRTKTVHDDTSRSRAISARNVSLDRGDWTTSDSFEVPREEISTGDGGDVDFEDSISRSVRIDNFSDEKIASRVDDTTNREAGTDSSVDASRFTPRGESTNIGVRDVTFNDAESRAQKSHDVLDDILDIIARESDRKKSIPDNESGKFEDVVADSVIDLLNGVENIVENNGRNAEAHLEGILCNKTDVPVDSRSEAVADRVPTALNNEAQSVLNAKDASVGNAVSASVCNDDGEVDDAKSVINIDLRVEIDNEEESLREATSEVREIIITELDSDSVEDHVLPELEIDAKIELAEDEESVDASVKENRYAAAEEDRGVGSVEIQECLEPILEQDSSDGEQLDNLVEVIESGLDTVEKSIAPSRAAVKLATIDGGGSARAEVAREEVTGGAADADTSRGRDEAAPLADNINKTFDILKDPDYEDISEESLEVSEILDKNETPKRSAVLPAKYRATQRSEEVLRILDEITQKSSPDSASDSQRDEREARGATEEISELLGAEVSAEDNVSSAELNRMTGDDRIAEGFNKADETGDRFSGAATAPQDKRSADRHPAEEKSGGGGVSARLHGDKAFRIIDELGERVSRLQEQDGSSESSEAGDTPRGVPEIELDSPRDLNDSKLDIDILDDDLLSGTKTVDQGVDVKTNFHSASIVATSEKDIEAMIDKLKASLEQPGLEVAELEAKLLRIEQLQIELEIKKLEAEEVSYYVREIPNKPPPPYTPPGDGRLSASLGSPSLLTAVIPSNVEELTSFTEKATALIYDAKLSGEDIGALETPSEIHELNKTKYETARKDRRIYNTFLFDLCKETIAEVYRSEYEKPGPSWTKPNVKTKPTVKVPRTVDELTEYVSKEVATLFGFKTKLQRENMVMRWSRKRRDRVDELLAREAQAEEDEWTKFHHDELAVKNGLTVAILDTLVMETANVAKIAYGKKRRMMI